VPPMPSSPSQGPRAFAHLPPVPTGSGPAPMWPRAAARRVKRAVKDPESEPVARTNAAKACKAETATPEADFRATHDGESFAEFYGRNKNDRNAYGKCVSSKAARPMRSRRRRG
jgi:hypothetical protein